MPQGDVSKDLQKIVDLVNDSEISSIKNVVTGLLKIINDPKSTTKDLTELIEVDPPLTAQVLKVANSAYYSPPSKIGEILKAVLWIGFDSIKELAMNQKVCQLFWNDQAVDDYSRLSLWKHSVAVALTGKMIYRREFGEKGEHIYAAGLLHDIGIIVEDQFCNEQFTEVLKSSQENKGFTSTEEQVFGFNHAVLGKAVMENWQMPEELCTAIGRHHDPARAAPRMVRMVSTLFLADTICRERRIGHVDGSAPDPSLIHQCMKAAGIERRALDLIINDVENQMTKMEAQGLFCDGTEPTF